MIAGAITPSGQSYACLCGCGSQDGPDTRHGFRATGGWKFGNIIDGCQAEYVLVPDALANLCPIPDGLSDEQVLMCPDIMSTGFSGAERGEVSIGDTVAVFALGPIGLCAVAGARLKGATTIIGVDAVAERMSVARSLGATHIVNFKDGNVVEQIMALTDGRGVDVSIEALGTQGTFESALRVLRPGGRLSSLGVYSSDLRISADDGDQGGEVGPTGASKQLSVCNRLLFVTLLARADHCGVVSGVGEPELRILTGFDEASLKHRLRRLMDLGLIRRCMPGGSSSIFVRARVSST